MAGHPQAESEAGKLIRLLIDYDGQKVHELSTDKQLPVSTLSLLYDFLTDKLEEYLETDLFIDLFRQFKRLQHPEHPLPGFQRVKAWSERWPSGLDEDVQQLRAYNKERILHALIQKIENRKNSASRFHFAEGISYEEKFRLVRFPLPPCNGSEKPYGTEPFPGQFTFRGNHVFIVACT